LSAARRHPEKTLRKAPVEHCAPPLLQALPSQKAQGILGDLGIGRTLPIYPTYDAVALPEIPTCCSGAVSGFACFAHD
jgi:hypothetical protein